MCRFYEQGKEREQLMLQFEQHETSVEQAYGNGTAPFSYVRRSVEMRSWPSLQILYDADFLVLLAYQIKEERKKVDNMETEKVKEEEVKDSSVAPDPVSTGLD